MALQVASVGSIPVTGPSSTLSTSDAAKAADAGRVSFESIVAQALTSLQSLQTEADVAAVDFVTGGSTELHDVMIAMEKLNLGFQLTLQLRNKVVEAYQEIMRMQV